MADMESAHKTMTVFYKKVGRRYVPVAEYDQEHLDSFPDGHHLVSVRPGVSSRRFKIDPALGPMIAAGLYAEDAISEVVRKAGEIRPTRTPISQEQRTAYTKFMNTLPENERYYLSYGSARDAAEAGVKAMQQEAEKLLTNPAVRTAWEQFLLVCKLTKEAQ